MKRKPEQYAIPQKAMSVRALYKTLHVATAHGRLGTIYGVKAHPKKELV